jgi:hypothetical protein
VSWDAAETRGERPRAPRRWLLVLVGLAVIAVAALAAGTGGEATESRDPEVLDIATGDPEDLELPDAPGAGDTLETESAGPEPELSETEPPPSPGIDGTAAPEPGLIVPGADNLAIVSLGEPGSPTTGGIELQRVDLATGLRSRASLTNAGFLGLWPQIAPLGDDLVVVVDGRAVRYDAALQPGEVLAEEARGVLAVPGQEQFWIIGGEPPFNTAGSTRLVSADGEVLLSVRLPGHVLPVAATERGMLLEAGGGVSVLEPDGDITSFASGELLAAVGDYVATIECSQGVACDIVVRDGSGETVRSRAVPEALVEMKPFLRQATSLSPDGRLLAYPAQTHPVRFEMRVLHIEDGAPLDIPSGLAATPYRLVEWAPVGRRLLLIPDTGGPPRWWDLDTDEITSLTGSGEIYSAEIVQRAP